MDSAIGHAIQTTALSTPMPDGTIYPTLSLRQTEQLAYHFGVTTRTIEINALENRVLPLRYARNFNTFTWQDQIRLLQSRATVVGLGGLGGTLVELLARAGVGSLVLVDGDVFEDHNLNRQLFSTQAALGTPKADRAKERVAAVNTSVEVSIHTSPFSTVNGLDLVKGSEVVVDCLDNIKTRFELQSIAQRAQRPLVSAAVAGLTGHVTTIFPEDKGLELIYGPLSALQDTRGAETRLGCLPQGVSAIAAIESAEVIKVLLGQVAAILRNHLLVVDLTANSFDLVNLI
jgi:molybdopterin/thiamine biosynthesis adenylyltransferase